VKHDPPDAVQFSLRALLLLLTVASVLFAALAPYVPRMETGRQWRTGGALISILLGTALGAIITTYRHRRARAQCGETLLMLPIDGGKTGGRGELPVPLVHLCASGTMVALLFALVAMDFPSERFSFSLYFYLVGIVIQSLLFSHRALADRWKLYSLCFCELGIVYVGHLFALNAGLHFGTWDQVVLRRWSMEDGSLSLMLNETFIPDTVPEEHRPRLDAILKEYLPECVPHPGV
jgi:hypothetical protein